MQREEQNDGLREDAVMRSSIEGTMSPFMIECIQNAHKACTKKILGTLLQGATIYAKPTVENNEPIFRIPYPSDEPPKAA